MEGLKRNVDPLLVSVQVFYEGLCETLLRHKRHTFNLCVSGQRRFHCGGMAVL